MSETVSTKDFIKIQRAAAQLAADAYEEEQEWCPTKTSRLLDACNRLEDLKQQRDDLREALEQIRDLETECCSRCEGDGLLYADGKAHLPSENAKTILCGNCDGSGRILPEDAQEIAKAVIKKAQ